MDMILDVQGAGFRYESQRMVFSEISFTLAEQEVLCILGPNGIGKSTLIRCLANLNRLCAGSIRLHNRDVRSLKRRDVARCVGYVPQAHEIVFPLPMAVMMKTARVLPVRVWALLTARRGQGGRDAA